MSSANRTTNNVRMGGQPGDYAVQLGVVLTRWACGAIARLYQRLAVLQWWCQATLRAATPACGAARTTRESWRLCLARRRLERELRAALLDVYATGVARGLCGQDMETGRELVEQMRGMWKAGRMPVHFGVLLWALSMTSCWLGRLLVARSV
jgi:hypothetical protein